MSSQYTTDIPFSASHEQQAFKLIELPPELLAALESDSPPTFQITSTPSTPTTPGYAILTSPLTPKKYQLRQKNTSNPILLLAPTITGPTDSDDQETFIGETAMTWISKIGDTIELIEIKEGQEEKDSHKVRKGKWHEMFAKGRVGQK